MLYILISIAYGIIRNKLFSLIIINLVKPKKQHQRSNLFKLSKQFVTIFFGKILEIILQCVSHQADKFCDKNLNILFPFPSGFLSFR